MFETESPETRKVIMEKLFRSDASESEKSAIREAMEITAKEKEFTDKIIGMLEKPASGSKSPEMPRVTVSQFCSTPPPYDILLPQGYLLWDKGLYKIGEEDDGHGNSKMQIACLTRTPFFVACRDIIGKLLVLRYINNSWEKKWIPATKIATRSTYFNFLIFPCKGVKFSLLQNYAYECAALSPFAEAAIPALDALLQDMSNDHSLDSSAAYPVLVGVSKIRTLCQEYEVSYNELRQRLVSSGHIQEESHIERDKDTKKPSRFLVFNKPLLDEDTSDKDHSKE